MVIEIADMAFVNSSLTSAATAIRVSRRTLHITRENLFWAFFYNVSMVSLAVAGLLSPILASAVMACPPVFVVLNSLCLHTAEQPYKRHECRVAEHPAVRHLSYYEVCV